MSEIKFSNFTNEDGSNGPDFVGLTTFTTPYYFVPPSGTTAQRPSGEGLAPGMLRFNTDIGRLEVWRGDHWATILGESPNLDGGARGVFTAGQTTTPDASRTDIDYITISTTGNSIDFGNHNTANGGGNQPFSDRVRGVFSGGFPGSNSIDFVTISSTGNAIDFGDLTQTSVYGMGCSNSTRGIRAGSYPSNQSVIDYVTIQSTGNAVSFGNLFQQGSNGASVNSSTRGIFAGGYGASVPLFNVIQYITTATTGNAQDFGDLSIAATNNGGGCSSTRGIFALGNTPAFVNIIEFITIATTGNSTDFGDSTTQSTHNGGGCCSSTRAVIVGGYIAPAAINNIEYVTISTTGDAIGFGDLQVAAYHTLGCSNGHGGL